MKWFSNIWRKIFNQKWTSLQKNPVGHSFVFEDMVEVHQKYPINIAVDGTLVYLKNKDQFCQLRNGVWMEVR